MKARVDVDHDGNEFGVLELTADDGYHAGTVVMLTIGKDGAPEVSIETSTETETHELMRVHMNDATARW